MRKPNLLGDRILVKQDRIKSKIIFVPTVAKSLEKSEGTVLAVGKDVSEEIKIGDHITYARYSPIRVIDFKDVYIITEGDVWWIDGEEIGEIEGFEKADENTPFKNWELEAETMRRSVNE